MYVLVCGTFISDRGVSDHMQIVMETALRFLVRKNTVFQRNMFRNSGFRSFFWENDINYSKGKSKIFCMSFDQITLN